MIFSAGLGTRFKPWTDAHPKALAMVNGKSLLQRNIEYLQQYGIYKIIVNVHHFSGQVIDQLSASKGWGSQVQVSDESIEVLETGGGLLKAKPYLSGETFLTINVDILTEMNLTGFINFHRQQRSLITVAVTNRKTARYLLFNQQDRMIGWRNTKTGEEKMVLPSVTVFEKAYSGIALFEPAVFDLIPFTGKFSLIDAYLSLAPYQKIAGYDHSGDQLIDVGKTDSLLMAEKMFP